MEPADLAKSGTESGHQRALFAAVAKELWQLHCQLCYRVVFSAIAAPTNEEKLHATKWDGQDRTGWAPARWLHAIANGGSRGDDAKSRAIRGGALKAEGVKAGIADVFLPHPRVRAGIVQHCGLYIEMKKPKKGRASPEQLEFAAYAEANGYKWVLCDTWDKAFSALVEYLAP